MNFLIKYLKLKSRSVQPLQGCKSCLHMKLRILCGAINIFPFQGKDKTVKEFATNNAKPLESFFYNFSLSKSRRDLMLTVSVSNSHR